jgi:hypothetical protein
MLSSQLRFFVPFCNLLSPLLNKTRGEGGWSLNIFVLLGWGILIDEEGVWGCLNSCLRLQIGCLNYFLLFKMVFFFKDILFGDLAF